MHSHSRLKTPKKKKSNNKPRRRKNMFFFLWFCACSQPLVHIHYSDSQNSSSFHSSLGMCTKCGCGRELSSTPSHCCNVDWMAVSSLCGRSFSSQRDLCSASPFFCLILHTTVNDASEISSFIDFTIFAVRSPRLRCRHSHTKVKTHNGSHFYYVSVLFLVFSSSFSSRQCSSIFEKTENIYFNLSPLFYLYSTPKHKHAAMTRQHASWEWESGNVERCTKPHTNTQKKTVVKPKRRGKKCS